MRRVVPILLAAVVLPACSSDEPESAAISRSATKQALAGAPTPLARLHRQANRLLDGGVDAFKERLRELRGYPVVVNKWASWCPPCRAEFPFFQSQALKRAKKVAFIGVDSDDNDGDARKFMGEFPVTFPSYKDPKLEIAAEMNAVAAFPSTAFYDSKGRRQYVHQGGYATERKLVDDIEQYALR